MDALGSVSVRAFFLFNVQYFYKTFLKQIVYITINLLTNGTGNG